jgi:hypothetical protein
MFKCHAMNRCLFHHNHSPFIAFRHGWMVSQLTVVINQQNLSLQEAIPAAIVAFVARHDGV